MSKIKQNFPVGSHWLAPYDHEVVVIEWEPFEKKFHDQMKLDPKGWNRYIPVRELPSGTINGYYPEMLRPSPRSELVKEERNVIEI